MQPLQTLSPELERILAQWETAATKTVKVRGELKRWHYDDTFGVVKEGMGTYSYEVPDKGKLEIVPVKDIPKAPDNVLASNGKSYTREPAKAEIWLSDGENIYWIDPKEKEYNVIDIPGHLRGQNIGKGPLPFLFGMKAAEIKSRYRLELGQGQNNNHRIIAYPEMPEEKVEYTRAEILISQETALPSAVQLVHGGGTSRTVYYFTKHDPVTMWLPTSPFNINKTALQMQYKKLLQDNLQEAQQPGGVIQR